MKETGPSDFTKEFAWEVLGWWDDTEQKADNTALPYCIWRALSVTGKVRLHVSNNADQMETIDFVSREAIDEFIHRLAQARDDLFIDASDKVGPAD